MEKNLRKQQPIISKLKEISDKTISPDVMTNIIQNIPAIDYERMSQAIGPLGLDTYQPEAITSTSTTKPTHKRSMSDSIDPITIDMNEGIDPTIIDKHKLKMPNEIVKEVAFNDEKLKLLTQKQKEIGKLVRTIGSRSRFDNSLKPELESLQRYNEAVKTILTKHSLIQKPTTKITGKGVKNNIYYTNPKELCERLTVLAGQIQAGNNSKHVKNELADVAHHLYKNKFIKKKDYRKILASI
jgi:hypothetical protein